MLFNNLNLSGNILSVLADMGFIMPTAVQEKCIPLIAEGKDVVGLSQTGSGKTLAFGLPIMQGIDKELGGVQAIVVCPTRELAVQTSNELKKFSSVTGVKIVSIYGGSDMQRQIAALKKAANIVVGTPGRIMDHLNRRTLKLGLIKTVVLDEADEMLNMGFREDIETILKSAPTVRQTVMFSATMPKEIMNISKNYMTNPVTVKIERTDLAGKTNQFFLDVKRGKKTEGIIDLLHELKPNLSLIFCNTKKMVDELTDDINQEGFIAVGIHGDKRQSERKRVMDSFKTGEKNILIATDVAARGIDVKGIDCVFNYDIPHDVEYYTHRIGRTGRAGLVGNAYTIISGKNQYSILMDFEKELKQEIKEYVSNMTDSEKEEKKMEKEIITAENAAATEITTQKVFVDKFVNAANKKVSEKAVSIYTELATLGFDDAKISQILIGMLAEKPERKEYSSSRSESSGSSYKGDRKPSYGSREGSSYSSRSSSYGSRSSYGDRSESRGDRPFTPRAPREDRPYAARAPREDRPFEARAPREDKPFEARAPREDRPYAARAPREDRPYADRAPREDRPYAARAPREDRPFEARSERAPRTYGARTSEGGERSFAPREGRSFEPRTSRDDRPKSYGEKDSYGKPRSNFSRKK